VEIMTAFAVAFLIVFVAEMGDKTQFMTLSFSTRYRYQAVVAGVFVATLVISLISALLGEAVGRTLPYFWIDLLAGLLFIGFGLWTLRGKEEEGEDSGAEGRFGPVLTVAVAFFLAEIGDRTMLATVMVASQQRNFLGVWLGSTLGLMASNALAILAGKLMGKRLPEKYLRYATAAVFVASGLLALFEAYRHR
jgi:putative Ca2+/H+ antiporter (TMEM165/GDT1 family)